MVCSWLRATVGTLKLPIISTMRIMCGAMTCPLDGWFVTLFVNPCGYSKSEQFEGQCDPDTKAICFANLRMRELVVKKDGTSCHGLRGQIVQLEGRSQRWLMR